jgi:hypothetical protein
MRNNQIPDLENLGSGCSQIRRVRADSQVRRGKADSDVRS